MDLYMYNWAGASNVLTKTLALDPPKISGTLRENCQVENPEITMQTDPRGFNYVYIPEFGRYYFITDITVLRENLFRVSMHVDVLMSFNAQIKALNVWGIRSSIIQTPNIPDGEAPISAERVKYPEQSTALLPHQFGNYILITVG